MTAPKTLDEEPQATSDQQPRKVNIIGHKNPDTDSICSAIAYAYLKNEIGPRIYEARRAGSINRETAFVLNHFDVEEPDLITSVRPQIKDLVYEKQEGIDASMSLLAAWTCIQEHKQDTLCITKNHELKGLVTVKDIANANMSIFEKDQLSRAKTPYKNILETLKGTMVVGNEDASITQGRLAVGTSADIMEDVLSPGDIVLVSDKYEIQNFAIEAGASCLIICCDAPVSKALIANAKAHKCTIISTPYETYSATRIISMSVPVSSVMLGENIVSFSVNTTVEEARKIMSSSRHRYFPVVNEDGTFSGVMSSANLINVKSKSVILVDHNEASQAVDGLEQAHIAEIIDHHRIGNIETTMPAFFRNEPVGCTSTVIYKMFEEARVTIPPKIAGIMLSAILSDTLAFRSPTCTPRDEEAARALAKIAGVDCKTYADEMFEAGASVKDRTPEEVFKGDFKVFSRGSARFGIGQGSYMTKRSRLAAEELIGPYLETAAYEEEVPLIFYLFTDIKRGESDLLYFGENAEELIRIGFDVIPQDGKAVLPGVVSRKKQVVPALMSALQYVLAEHEEA